MAPVPLLLISLVPYMCRAVFVAEIVTFVPLGKYLPKEYTEREEKITVWQKEGLYERVDHTA